MGSSCSRSVPTAPKKESARASSGVNQDLTSGTFARESTGDDAFSNTQRNGIDEDGDHRSASPPSSMSYAPPSGFPVLSSIVTPSSNGNNNVTLSSNVGRYAARGQQGSRPSVTSSGSSSIVPVHWSQPQQQQQYRHLRDGHRSPPESDAGGEPASLTAHDSHWTFTSGVDAANIGEDSLGDPASPANATQAPTPSSPSLRNGKPNVLNPLRPPSPPVVSYSHFEDDSEKLEDDVTSDSHCSWSAPKLPEPTLHRATRDTSLTSRSGTPCNKSPEQPVRRRSSSSPHQKRVSGPCANSHAVSPPRQTTATATAAVATATSSNAHQSQLDLLKRLSSQGTVRSASNMMYCFSSQTDNDEEDETPQISTLPSLVKFEPICVASANLALAWHSSSSASSASHQQRLSISERRHTYVSSSNGSSRVATAATIGSSDPNKAETFSATTSPRSSGVVYSSGTSSTTPVPSSSSNGVAETSPVLNTISVVSGRVTLPECYCSLDDTPQQSPRTSS